MVPSWKKNFSQLGKKFFLTGKFLGGIFKVEKTGLEASDILAENWGRDGYAQMWHILIFLSSCRRKVLKSFAVSEIVLTFATSFGYVRRHTPSMTSSHALQRP
jgi:hypothetical protein